MTIKNRFDGNNFPFNLIENEFIFIPSGIIKIYNNWVECPKLYIENNPTFGVTAYDEEDIAVMEYYKIWTLYYYQDH